MSRRSFLVFLSLVVLTSLLQSVSADQDYLDSLMMNATILSSGVDRSIASIQSSFEIHNIRDRSDSNKQRTTRLVRLDELRSIAEEIKERKKDMVTYSELGNSELAEKSATEIIYKSDEIYAYECLFQLDFANERLKGFKIDQEIRFRDTNHIDALIGDAEKLKFSDYNIVVGEDKIFKTYSGYLEKCDLKRGEISSLSPELIKYSGFSGLGNTGFLGTVLLMITIPCIVSIISYQINFRGCQQKIGIDNFDTYLFLVLLSTFSLWGLFYDQSSSYLGRLSSGFIWGIAASFILFYIPEKLGDKIGLINKKQGGKIPIEDLGVGGDYIELLKGSDIETIEEFLDSDIKDLSEESALQVETLIKFRDKARNILERHRVE